MAKFTGQDAIDYAARTGAQLNKYADPTEGARSGLTVAEAEDVAAEDPGLVWCDAIEERPLSPAEREAIRANARGEDVYCGDDASAIEIARGACDRDSEWSEEAIEEATRLARDAWVSSRA